VTRRRPTEVYSTATPSITGPIAGRELTRRYSLPSLIPPQPTGVRDLGGGIGQAFSLPSYITNASTSPAPASLPTAAPAGIPPEDCGCG